MSGACSAMSSARKRAAQEAAESSKVADGKPEQELKRRTASAPLIASQPPSSSYLSPASPLRPLPRLLPTSSSLHRSAHRPTDSWRQAEGRANVKAAVPLRGARDSNKTATEDGPRVLPLNGSMRCLSLSTSPLRPLVILDEGQQQQQQLARHSQDVRQVSHTPCSPAHQSSHLMWPLTAAPICVHRSLFSFQLPPDMQTLPYIPLDPVLSGQSHRPHPSMTRSLSPCGLFAHPVVWFSFCCLSLQPRPWMITRAAAAVYRRSIRQCWQPSEASRGPASACRRQHRPKQDECCCPPAKRKQRRRELQARLVGHSTQTRT